MSSSSAFLPIRPMFEAIMTFSVLPGAETKSALPLTSSSVIAQFIFFEPRISLSFIMNVRGFGIPLHHLPNELQGELHLSRSCDRRTRQQSRVVQCSRRRKGLSRARRWGIEVCVIEDVEDLPPKLHVERFRDPMNWVVFEQGKIKVL